MHRTFIQQLNSLDSDQNEDSFYQIRNADQICDMLAQMLTGLSSRLVKKDTYFSA